MVRNLGTPTWFMTLTMNELCWAELLCELVGREIRGHDFTLNDEDLLERVIQEYNDHVSSPEKVALAWKRKLIHNHPTAVVKFFERRVQQLVQSFGTTLAHAVGRVVDHFVRIEFQLRGFPHAHILLWVEGAPDLEDMHDLVRGMEYPKEIGTKFMYGMAAH